MEPVLEEKAQFLEKIKGLEDQLRKDKDLIK